MTLIAESEFELAEPTTTTVSTIAPPISARQVRGAEKQPSPSPLPPKPKSARYQSLDMWRGVACMMLVFYHTTFYADAGWRTLHPETWSLGSLSLNLLTRLWVGVPMFFVVSGYCIAASVDSLRRKPHSLTNYFARRIRRIYPPLWAGFGVAIAFFALLAFFSPAMFARCVQLPALSELSLLAWIGNFTATESWLSTVAGQKPNYLLLNTWTLCYEEQFYIVTGVLLFISARRFFTAAAIVTAVVFLVRTSLTLLGIDFAGFFIDGHWLMFAMGLLVYQRINYYRGRGKWSTWLLLGAAIAYGLAMRVLCDNYEQRHLGEYIAVAGAFALALVYLKPFDLTIVQHPLVQPLNWCGKISYSIYLTHFAVVIFVSSLFAAYGITSDGLVVLLVLPLCVALSIAIGWVFYMLVERHFINQPVAN
jgi:peptidoglycan/LPS O-acetylase OafA/YrhL